MPKLFMEIEEDDWQEYKEYLKQKNTLNMVNMSNIDLLIVLRKMGYEEKSCQYSVNADEKKIACDYEYTHKRENDIIKIHREYSQYKYLGYTLITDIDELQKIVDEENKREQEKRKPL